MATYLYDIDNATFKRIGPVSNADENAPGGDTARYPTFTDYDASGTPQTVLLGTRLNITSDGTIAEEGEDGLNPSVERPVQVYSIPISAPSQPDEFTRIFFSSAARIFH